MRYLLILTLLFCLTNCSNKENTERNKTSDMEKTSEKTNNSETGNEIVIVAEMRIKPEYAENIKPIFENIAANSQKENGCIYYHVHQAIGDSTKFVILEKWKSQEAIDFHNNTIHFKEYKEKTKDMFSEKNVILYKQIH
ncbi:MAG: putative quinol monooxygenase [Dysgonomonas sp.]